MPYARQTCTMPYISPQECPTCLAPADRPCRTPSRKHNLKEIHVARYTLEFGEWTRIWDERYRDKGLRFRIVRYGR